MSMTAALSSASSSLRTIQVQLSVASANIANADTDGYTVKTAKQTTVVSDGIGVGVTVGGIVSNVDATLLRDIVAATSANGEAATLNDYLARLGEAFGTVSSDDDSTGDGLASRLSDLESTLDELASTPESETLKAQAVAALDDVATALRETSSTVQGLRADADRDIAASVATVNDALATIDQLNDDIRIAQANGDSTADLDDLRMAQLQTVAGELDISYFVDGSGAMRVYTSSGQTLVDSRAHLLSHDTVGMVTSTTTFDAVTVDGQDITGTLRSGNLAALVTLRDETLPAVQDQLDELAVSLRDGLNTAAGGSLLTGTGAADLTVDSAVLDDPSTLPVTTSDGASALADALRDNDFAGTAGDIVSDIGVRMASAAAAASAEETSLATLTSRFQSQSGVNLDEETARITELENAYSAASQVIAAIQSMFESLLQAMR